MPLRRIKRLMFFTSSALMVGAGSVPAWATDELPALDTLLYTPAQRQAIVRARQGLSEVQVQSTVQRLSGVVRRADSRGTVWLNGQALPEGAQSTPRIVGVDAVVRGKRLRVGESVDELSGAKTDVVAPGAVTVHRSK
jgi:hypothetical protein